MSLVMLPIIWLHIVCIYLLWKRVPSSPDFATDDALLSVHREHRQHAANLNERLKKLKQLFNSSAPTVSPACAKQNEVKS